MKWISTVLLGLCFVHNPVAVADEIEKLCRKTITETILASATAVVGEPVVEVKDLDATGKTVLTPQGETLEEYKTGTFATDDGILPGSNVTAYVLKGNFACAVMRLTINLR